MIYAVHRYTKEHRLYDFGDECSEYHESVAADADGWVRWDGGECPLPKNALVEVKHRDGDIYKEPCGFCRSENWSHIDSGSDIIAYRPILDDKPHAPEGDGEGLPPVGTVCGIGDCVVFPTGRGVIRLGPDVNNVVIVEDYSDGYKRAALSACELIRTDREKWVEAAEPLLRVGNTETVLGNIYDALRSGELPNPASKTGGDA